MTSPNSTEERKKTTPDGQPPEQDPKKPALDKSPEALKRNRLGAFFIGIIVVSFIVSMYPLPYKLFAGVVAVFGIIWGIRFIVAATKAKQAGSWAVTGVLGILMCLYAIGSSLSTLVIYPIQQAYEECTMSALTQEAAVSCTTNYQQGLTDTLNRISGW